MIINMDISFELIGVIGLIIIGVFAALLYLYFFWDDIRKNYPVLPVLRQVQKTGAPLINWIDPVGTVLWFAGIPAEKRMELPLKNEGYGLLFDPQKIPLKSNSRLYGTPIYTYFTDYYLPLSPHASRTVVQLVTRIRKEYKALNFIKDDGVLLALLSKSGADLIHDIETVIHMYPLEKYYEELSEHTPEGDSLLDTIITPQTVASILEEIKGKLKTWKVQPGYFSMYEGLSQLPIGTTSNDMLRLETITRTSVMNDVAKEPSNTETLMKFIIAVVVVLVVAYMVIINVRPA